MCGGTRDATSHRSASALNALKGSRPPPASSSVGGGWAFSGVFERRPPLCGGTHHATIAFDRGSAASSLGVETAHSATNPGAEAHTAASTSPSSTRWPLIFTCESRRPTISTNAGCPSRRTSLHTSPVRKKRRPSSAFTKYRSVVSVGALAYPKPTSGPANQTSASVPSGSRFSSRRTLGSSPGSLARSISHPAKPGPTALRVSTDVTSRNA